MRPAMGRTGEVVWLIAAIAAVLLGTSGRASASMTPLLAQASYSYDGSSQPSAPTAAMRTGTTLTDARSTERAAKVATRSHAVAAAGFAAEDAGGGLTRVAVG